MIETQVLLDTMSKVQEFNAACQKHIGEVTVYSGKYIVNGKSIMGLYSLDLATPIKVDFEGEIEEEIKPIIGQYVI